WMLCLYLLFSLLPTLSLVSLVSFSSFSSFFFTPTATTNIYTLSLHDALPIYATPLPTVNTTGYIDHAAFLGTINPDTNKSGMVRSEERFSRNAETDLVCRLLLEKKKKNKQTCTKKINNTTRVASYHTAWRTD